LHSGQSLDVSLEIIFFLTPTSTNVMQVIHAPIERIIPYARNPRNNEIAVAKVAASIKEFGWRQPIVVDEQMTVIAGHTRLLAARQLELKSVPVHIATDLTNAQIKAYRLADNRTHEESEWDNELLKIELEELKVADFDLNLTGFDLYELEDLLEEELLTDPMADEESALATPVVPTSRLGDVWILGQHKLLCGDALDTESYTKLLAGDKADMVFTDPPYNVDYCGSLTAQHLTRTNGLGKRDILNDNLQSGFYGFLYAASKCLIDHCKGAMYIFMAASELDTLHKAFTQAGGHWSTFIIWAKNHFAVGGSDYQRQFEVMLYGWPKDKKHFWCGARDQSDLWSFNKIDACTLHPTMKPVELVAKAIGNSSKSGDIVLDSFAGSGSTVIACEKANRICRAIELDPKYCDVIVQRWQEFTGRTATLSGTDQTFAHIETDRRVS
jgi:DNA modification methylase